MDLDSGIKYHGLLVGDPERTGAYRKAILETVSAGDVVLDIGTGSGIMAMFACQAGAARVYAVDSSDILAVAKQLAEANGYAERIRFMQQDIRSVVLPERVDVIISELITSAVLGDRMEELVALSRERFLKPKGGRIIPQSVELWIAPVETPEVHHRIQFPDADVYEVDFSHARQMAVNNTYLARIRPDQLLAGGQRAYEVDLSRVTAGQHPDATMRFAVRCEGLLHGYCGWFSATLASGIVLSAHPPGLPSFYNQFFPIPGPVEVRPGMTVALRLKGVHPPGMQPIWQWATDVRAAAEEAGEARVVAQYEQSSFAGFPLSTHSILRRSGRYRPVLSSSGQMMRSVLDWCSGEATVGEMAERLMARYPDSVASYSEAEQSVQAILLGLYGSGHAA